MSDRTLVHVREQDAQLGIDYHLTVHRSSLGAPGGFVEITRVEDGGDEDTLSIQLSDLRVLRAVIEWADGGPVPRNVEMTDA